MKWVDFVSPHSITEAVELLSNANGEARILAGGTDLLVQIRADRLQTDLIVDGKNIPELNSISFDSRSGLTIGAAVPCYQIYGNKDVQDNYPGLIDSTSLIGGTQIQGRATLGGNLCNAAPSADSIPLMIALCGTATISGPNGTREVPVEDICTGPGKNLLDSNEILEIVLEFPR